MMLKKEEKADKSVVRKWESAYLGVELIYNIDVTIISMI